ncbi:MAG: hypothetical protein KGL39_47695 [Patescibacteria group bacterium]|nr:hypothetical protein [Patescibacteria group bacterium]
MPYGWIDDKAWCNPKFRNVGAAAMGLYWSCVSWANFSLTDGHVPAYELPSLLERIGIDRRRSTRLAAEYAAVLEREKLFEPSGDGYQIHDFQEYNKAAQEVRADREVLRQKRAEAGRRGGLKSGQVRSEAKKQNRSNAEANAKPVTDTDPIPDPFDLFPEKDLRAVDVTTASPPPPPVSTLADSNFEVSEDDVLWAQTELKLTKDQLNAADAEFWQHWATEARNGNPEACRTTGQWRETWRRDMAWKKANNWFSSRKAYESSDRPRNELLQLRYSATTPVAG